ncbi:zinc finger protein 91 [Lingula anatina]|uniref:Zinc finger protein 91 n=1 Tax=Lingula anatina TaxID=7574 RepID=A0A1S3JVH0_LINAN|nr:zinc finger protein 91 [Lingula anatina]|eukprot:XP_013414287.1 zinc finger protein 91 [Lingula anatina]
MPGEKTFTVRPSVLYPSEILSKLNAWRMQGTFCDICLQAVDGTSSAAHRLVLAAASQYFAKILQEESSDIYNLRLSQKDLGLLLDYVYGKDVILTMSEAMLLKKIASEYGFSSLYETLSICVLKNPCADKKSILPEIIPKNVKAVGKNEKETLANVILKPSAEKEKKMGLKKGFNTSCRIFSKKQNLLYLQIKRKYLVRAHYKKKFVRSNEKWHACYKCCSCFMSARNLHFHEKLKHSFTGKASTKELNKLKCHSQTEKELKVSLSLKAGQEKIEQKRRKIKVSSFDVFPCSYCFKEYKSYDKMKNHLRTCATKLDAIKKIKINIRNQTARAEDYEFPEEDDEENLGNLDPIYENSSETRTLYETNMKEDNMSDKQRTQDIMDIRITRSVATTSLLRYQFTATSMDRERLITDESVEEILACSICGAEQLSRDSLQLHLAVEHLQGPRFTRPVPCPVCSVPYDFKVLLLIHVRTKHVKEEQIHTWSQISVCDENGCNAILLGSAERERHMDIHARRKERNKKTFKCLKCTAVFDSSSTLRDHARDCPGVPKKLRSPSYKCKLCGAGFVKMQCLWRHEHTKHGISHDDKKLHCAHKSCKFQCFTSTQMSLHQNCHKETKSFACDKCGKTYKAKKNLHQHYRLIHELKDKQICKKCGKTLRTASTLQKHETRCGVKDRPLKCPQCNLSFITADSESLDYHMFAKHGIVPKNRDIHICEVCGYQTTRKAILKKHLISHSEERNFKCSYCDRAFKHRNTLLQHTKIHSDDRPFQCQMCNYSAKKSTSLQSHIRLQHTHKGLKPYKCPYCSHCATVRWNCHKHITTAHPGKEVRVELLACEPSDQKVAAQDGGTTDELSTGRNNQNASTASQNLSEKSSKDNRFPPSSNLQIYQSSSGSLPGHLNTSGVENAGATEEGQTQQKDKTLYSPGVDSAVYDIGTLMNSSGLW